MLSRLVPLPTFPCWLAAEDLRAIGRASGKRHSMTSHGLLSSRPTTPCSGITGASASGAPWQQYSADLVPGVPPPAALVLCRNMGQFEDAIADYTRAIELDPRRVRDYLSCGCM